MSNIKNIIFDLGGVIININPDLTIQAFKEAGIADIENVYAALKVSGHLYNIESGEITVDELYNEFINLTSFHINKGKFIACWNALLLDIPQIRIELLKELRKNYKLFLLSNTNPIHMEAIYGYVEKVHDIELNSLFDKVYLSYEHNICKPDIEIFRKIIKDNDLTPQETLFIDDTAMHLESAEKTGIITALVTPARSINNIISEIDQ